MARGTTRSRRLRERGRGRLALLSIVLLIALGCSSGGSGGSAAPAEITTDNAPVISATTVDAAVWMGGLADIGVPIPLLSLSASVPGRGGASEALSLETLPLELIRLFAGSSSGDERDSARSPGPDVALQVAIPPTVIPCDIDGSIRVTGRIANPAALTVGDRFSGDFSDCDEDLGVIFDGGLSFTIVSFSPSVAECFLDPNECVDENELTVDTVLRNFAVTDGGSTFTGNGDMSIAIDTLALPTSVAQFSGRSLTVSDGTHSETLRRYDTLTTTTSGDYETVASGRLTSSRFSGEVQYDTTQAFLGTGISDPISGVLRIDGADFVTIDVVAQDDGVHVDLMIDFDGDDIPDEVQTMTWDELWAELL